MTHPDPLSGRQRKHPEPKVCHIHVGRPAFYYVGKKGFCYECKELARALAKAKGREH